MTDLPEADRPHEAQEGERAPVANGGRRALKRWRRLAQPEIRRRDEATQHRRRLVAWGGGILAAVLVIGGLVYWLSRPATGPGAMPGPLGGPSVAQDVNTLVGQPAPAFALADADGTTYPVTPGQGRPLVLVFHMGIT